jgi:regulator of sigma E protease
MLITEDNKDRARDVKAYVVEVDEGSPAEEAGIKEFDRVVSISTEESPGIAAIQRIGQDMGGQEVTIEVDRQGMRETVTVVPRKDPPPGEGPIGMALQEIGLLSTPWYKTPAAGVTRTYEMLVVILGRFWQLISEIVGGGKVGDILTGPIGIAIYTGEATSMGISYILEFAALISLNLAIINFIPFPALDGGRVLFILFELVSGKRLSNKFEHWAHMTGFVLLIALMVYVTINDIGRFF